VHESRGSSPSGHTTKIKKGKPLNKRWVSEGGIRFIAWSKVNKAAFV
jgi:hypothetical protein